MILFSIVSEGKIWNLYGDFNNNNVYICIYIYIIFLQVKVEMGWK